MNADRTFSDRIAATLRSAPAIELPTTLVEACIDSGQASAQLAESQFRSAFEGSLEAVPRRTRAGGLNGVTGHIAESVAESILVDAGWTPVEHFVGPFSGGHGIDLALLSPSLEHLFVVEVKGTLQPGRWPRLTLGEIDQMSLEWLSGPDNAGMRSLGLDGNAVSGLVLLFQFARRQWKGVLTPDFDRVWPLSGLGALLDPLEGQQWLDPPPGNRPRPPSRRSWAAGVHTDLPEPAAGRSVATILSRPGSGGDVCG